jgi:hypothetical protein
VSKNKTEFFRDSNSPLFLVSFVEESATRREQKKDRREQNFITLLKKGQNSS